MGTQAGGAGWVGGAQDILGVQESDTWVQIQAQEALTERGLAAVPREPGHFRASAPLLQVEGMPTLGDCAQDKLSSASSSFCSFKDEGISCSLIIPLQFK